MKNNLTMLLLVTLLFGCEKNPSFEDEVVCRIAENVRELYYEDIKSSERFDKSKALAHSILSNTNTAMRIKFFSLWGNAVLGAKIPISTNDYQKLDRMLSRVKYIVRDDIMSGLRNCEGGEEALFDMCIKFIEWHRTHIKKLLAVSDSFKKAQEKFMFPTNCHIYSGLDISPLGRWKSCYHILIGGYYSNVNMLEGRWLPHELKMRKIPCEVRDRIRAKIENCLGRTLRTETEVSRDYVWNTMSRPISKRRLATFRLPDFYVIYMK